VIDPSVVVLAAVAAFFYVRGSHAVPLRRRISFFAGLAAVCVALCRWMEGAAATRFSAHMAQHMILLLVAPPLLAYGRPLLAFMMSTSSGTRHAIRRIETRFEGALRVAGHPVFVGALYTTVLWIWHAPVLYQAAIRNAPVHSLEHLTFLLTGVMFWGTVIGPGTKRRVSYPAALGLIFSTMLPGVWLAMILTFAPHLVYPVYGAHAGALADQELAGAVMWAPMAFVSSVVIGALFLRWFRLLDLRSEVRPAVRVEGQP
jgi:putative membrane protein